MSSRRARAWESVWIPIGTFLIGWLYGWLYF